MSEPLVFYSTNTLLAYHISEKYYGAKHFVWCTPHFDSWSGSGEFTVPDSSSPKQIFIDLYRAVSNMDRHSTKIKENRLGLKRGVAAKKQAGIIDDAQAKEILGLIKNAESGLFRPYLYIIPYSLIKDQIIEVPVQLRANPAAEEYKILELPRSCFDRIEYAFGR
jgi:hypothetical protein